jgi:hypothetical protein
LRRARAPVPTGPKHEIWRKSSWDNELDEQGFAKMDDTWQHRACVINLLREHVDRYPARNGVAHLRHAS